MKDKAPGAEDRAQEKAYIWTKLDTQTYTQMALKEENLDVQDNVMTIAEGMAKTGGYEGTDLDQSEESINI